jgi:hypothetical protein
MTAGNVIIVRTPIYIYLPAHTLRTRFFLFLSDRRPYIICLLLLINFINFQHNIESTHYTRTDENNRNERIL